MTTKIQSIRGMNDYLPEETLILYNIEEIFKKILLCYGYKEIRLPIIEKTSLFHKAIGEITDITEKEMYNFVDKSNNNITLRPEGTIGCVRAGIEHGILHNQEQRFWYLGPMFRYERPQKGRYRQFYQMGIEVFGQKSPNIDAELILIINRYWTMLGINNHVSLTLNSIGSISARLNYRKHLTKFLIEKQSLFNDDYRKRIYTNPMRILDSKDPNVINILEDAPKIIDYIDDCSRKHFNDLCVILNNMGIVYTVNPYLVRGLDYYNDTVFEWITNNIDIKYSICGGGRYDNLVNQLGGKPTPAIGLAIGLERLASLVNNSTSKFKKLFNIDIYIIMLLKNEINISVLLFIEQLHDALPHLIIRTNYEVGCLKKQLKKANKYKSHLVLILDDNYLINSKIIIKNLYTGTQDLISQSEIIFKINSILKN